MSRDPIEERGGLNLYAYVSNRPICQVDSLGLLRLKWPWVDDRPPCEYLRTERGPWSRLLNWILGKESTGNLGNGTMAVSLDAYGWSAWKRTVRHVYKCKIGCLCVQVYSTKGTAVTTTQSSPINAHGSGLGATAVGLNVDFTNLGPLITRYKQLGPLYEEASSKLGEAAGLQQSLWTGWYTTENWAPEPPDSRSGRLVVNPELPNSLRQVGKGAVDCRLTDWMSDSVVDIEKGESYPVEE